MDIGLLLWGGFCVCVGIAVFFDFVVSEKQNISLENLFPVGMAVVCVFYGSMIILWAFHIIKF